MTNHPTKAITNLNKYMLDNRSDQKLVVLDTMGLIFDESTKPLGVSNGSDGLG